MSDTPQGEGWWVASDGKWYPPEQHPVEQPLPASAASGAGAQQDDGGSGGVWQRFRSLPVAGQIAVWVLLALVVLGGLAAIAEDDDSDAAEGATSPEDETTSDTESPTVAEETTTTTEPTTTTTEPTTTTTEPTTTTTEPPPEPIRYEGSGADVIEIDKPADAVVVHFAHQGSRNFIVTALDSNLDRVGGVVNHIGNYDGIRPLDFLDRDETSFLEIQADGTWQVELRPITSTRVFDDAIEGSGDEVIFFVGDTGVADVTHSGERNFIVTAWGDRRSGVVNEIGPYSGGVPIQGDRLIEIRADGAWSFALRD